MCSLTLRFKRGEIRLSDIFKKLYRHPYKGVFEGLEECLPKFRSKSIVLYTGNPLRGGGGRRSRKVYGRKKPRRRVEIWFEF